MDPMLLPETTTRSYHMNSKSSAMCPVGLMRWCWGSYLGLTPPNKGINCCSLESYTQALKTCKWFKETIEMKNFKRLIIPQFDLPRDLNRDNAPIVIVTTSKADPLRDDGLDLVQKIKSMHATTTTTTTKGGGEGGSRKKKIYHFEGRGSHAFSLMFDTKERDRFLKCWHDAIWN